MTLAEKLKEARKNMGMTQAELAESLCVSRQAITKIRYNLCRFSLCEFCE